MYYYQAGKSRNEVESSGSNAKRQARIPSSFEDAELQAELHHAREEEPQGRRSEERPLRLYPRQWAAANKRKKE